MRAFSCPRCRHLAPFESVLCLHCGADHGFDWPRRELLALLPDVPEKEEVRAVIDASGPPPNVDFGIAAFALLTGMPADAGEAIFAIARTAGWIAHALEEYGDRPSRFRPSGRYVG